MAKRKNKRGKSKATKSKGRRPAKKMDVTATGAAVLGGVALGSVASYKAGGSGGMADALGGVVVGGLLLAFAKKGKKGDMQRVVGLGAIAGGLYQGYGGQLQKVVGPQQRLLSNVSNFDMGGNQSGQPVPIRASR